MCAHAPDQVRISPRLHCNLHTVMPLHHYGPGKPVETFLLSYNMVWRDYLQKQNLSQTIDLLAHLGGPQS